MTHEPRPVLDFPGMAQAALAALRSAVQALERPSLAARLANLAGKPIELIEYALPTSASQAITAAASKALEVALQVALRTIQRGSLPASQRFHKALATASGAVGGAFGLGALPLELPVSTVIMLRSIAEIARSEGEDLSDPEAALSCVQVFALGGRPGSSDASESGYFAVRAMLAKSVTQAARFIVERGVLEEGGPILVRFISQVASRFHRDAKGRSTSRSTRRRAGRRCRQLCIRRAFPGDRARTLHRASTRASIWQGHRPQRI